ncbi:MAG: RluA family pseudouridine synthase [Flavobacteriales bacterium]|nr:RluA family pseudouridine synthase [Flavobacteriales bacterium]
MSSTDDPTVPVLFEDPSLLIVRKPSGMPVLPDQSGDRDLLTILRDGRNEPGLELPHRIDRPVSGVVLLARNASVNSAMNDLFRERLVIKHYRAIVEGCLPEGEQEWKLDNALRHDTKSRRAIVIRDPSPTDEMLRITVCRLAQGDRYALVGITPLGGAFHQIRAQLAAWGHVIKGDVKYGARRGEKDRSIALHAHALRFTHPVLDVPIFVEADQPSSPIWLALSSMTAGGAVRS